MIAKQSRHTSARTQPGVARQDVPVLFAAQPSQTVEVILCAGRAVAYLIPVESRHVMEIVKLVFAMAPESWRNDMRLVRAWECWAVVCDQEWGAFMRDKPRPMGKTIAFIG